MSLDKRIFLLGEIDYMSLLSLYKRSKKFIHLAYIDHCPNVVVDAQAAGCHIICSSTGGTKEVVKNGTIVQEEVWDMKPCKLYKPPALDFSNVKNVSNTGEELKYCIEECMSKYFEVFEELL